MFPVYNLNGIIEKESYSEGNHVVILLLVKPSDADANKYIDQFNYYDKLSNGYCNIYLPGYSEYFCSRYPDVKKVNGINTQTWEYSDQCFIEVKESLEERLSNWEYSGVPEMIILQNDSATNPKQSLNFQNYICIDINYGIKKGYIESFPRFMENLLTACKDEVTAVGAVNAANRKRISPRKVLELAIEQCPKLPKSIGKILNDRIFFKSCHGSVSRRLI